MSFRLPPFPSGHVLQAYPEDFLEGTSSRGGPTEETGVGSVTDEGVPVPFRVTLVDTNCLSGVYLERPVLPEG